MSDFAITPPSAPAPALRRNRVYPDGFRTPAVSGFLAAEFPGLKDIAPKSAGLRRLYFQRRD